MDGPVSIILIMGDAVAIISVIASSAVAVAAIAAQLWQARLTRLSEQHTWLRDRRAETYIAIFRLFEKTPAQVTQDEWEQLTASVRAFASPTMSDLFTKWGDASRVTWDKKASNDARQKAYQDADAAQQQLGAQAILELQGRRPRLLTQR